MEVRTKEVNIYTISTINGLGKSAGAYGYILEWMTSKGPATLTKFEREKDITKNQSHLKVLIAALKRLKVQCMVHIYTDSTYAAAGFEQGWIEKWKQNEWKNAKGEPVANMEEWRQLSDLLEKHWYDFHISEPHSYLGWMRTEVEKEKEICLKDLENLTQQKK